MFNVIELYITLFGILRGCHSSNLTVYEMKWRPLSNDPPSGDHLRTLAPRTKLRHNTHTKSPPFPHTMPFFSPSYPTVKLEDISTKHPPPTSTTSPPSNSFDYIIVGGIPPPFPTYIHAYILFIQS